MSKNIPFQSTHSFSKFTHFYPNTELICDTHPHTEYSYPGKDFFHDHFVFPFSQVFPKTTKTQKKIHRALLLTYMQKNKTKLYTTFYSLKKQLMFT